MLKINEIMIRKDEEVVSCQAMVFNDGEFECFLEIYEDLKMIQYSASATPHITGLYTEEEYVGDDFIELFVESNDPELNDSEGLEESKYFAGYREMGFVIVDYLTMGDEGVCKKEVDVEI